MKKTYIAPKAVAYNVNTKCEITVTSPGVTTGSILGKGFNANDESYVQEEEDNTISIWDLY